MTTALVLGGARSGKSTWAERRMGPLDDVVYVATSQQDPDDAEWVERVAAHQARRPDSWRTVETLDVAGVLRETATGGVLVDCLAVWLTRVLDELDAWNREDWDPGLTARVDELVAAIEASTAEVVLVSNEVGLSVVPETRAGRLFRDQLGILNARVAQAVDEVWFSIAGITKRWD